MHVTPDDERGFRAESGQPTFTTMFDWACMAPLPDASYRVYAVCKMFTLKDGGTVVSLTNEEIAQLIPYQDGKRRTARAVHNAMKPLIEMGLLVEVESTKISVEVPGKTAREVRTVRTFVVRDEPICGWASYGGPVNPFVERQRLATDRREASQQRRRELAADAAATVPTPERKDFSAQDDQGEECGSNVFAGQPERKNPSWAGKDFSWAGKDFSAIGSKYGEASTGKDGLRPSVPRAGARAGEDRPGGDRETKRTDGRREASSKERKTIRGIDLQTVYLDSRRIEVTDEHRELAAALAVEVVGTDGHGEGADPELHAAVIAETGLWSGQQADLLRLLPRAVAAADGNVDAVRGWLLAKGTAANTAKFVLDAFADEHIGDVARCRELARADVRAEQARLAQEEAARAAHEAEERLNAAAEGHWGREGTSGTSGGSQRLDHDPWAETEDTEPVPDPAQELLAEAAPGLDPTPAALASVRAALDAHGTEAVILTIKRLIESGGLDRLRSALRYPHVLMREIQ